jgi:hypothetical protein
MMGGKGGASVPNYTPIAQADERIAQQNADLEQQQFQFSQDQYNLEKPYLQQQLERTSQNADIQSKLGADIAGQYENTYLPLQQQYASEAANYNSAANQDQLAGKADADVANAFTGQKNQSLQRLESYGIDPSQTRFAALDLGTSIQQAAATAAAGTSSRQNTANTAFSLQNSAIGQGLSALSGGNAAFGSAASGAATGSGAFNSGFGTANSGNSAASGFGNTAVGANNGASGALNNQFNDQQASNNANNQLFGEALGAIGGGLGFVSGHGGFGGVAGSLFT